MRTKILSLQVKCVLAAVAGLVGCNAILDNQEGHLMASETGGTAGRSSVGGHSGTPGGSANVGGATNGGSKSSVGGNTSVGGTATTLGGTKAAGGVSNVGGAQGTGGATTLGGSTSSSTSNTNAVGGVTNLGGNPPTGGAKATGGVNAGTTVTGGTSAIGTIAVGGAPATGGRTGTGGTSANNGGAPPTGGTKSTGGAPSGTGGAAPATGGAAPATGGAAPTGGAKSTGGAPATGGAATGGTSAIAGPSVVFVVATVNEGASTSLTTATFGFGSNPAGAASSYLCKFNAATTFTDCTSGLSLSQLSAGGQTLTVHALNSQGIAGPDATRSWSVAPLTTTIKNIRTLGTLTDNLVTVTTNVRVTGFGTQGGQVIFVQEAGPATSLVVDAPSDLTGSPVLNAGILTRALTTQTARAEGAPVTVTGTVSMNGQSLELARSSYIWGTGTAIPYNVPEVRTSTVYASTLEGVRIGLAGQIPSFNCSSSCFNPQIGNSNLCIETTCMDTGCGTNKILAWLDITGNTSPPVTSGYGIWNGWLVKRSSYYELWTNSSDSYGNDLCL